MSHLRHIDGFSDVDPNAISSKYFRHKIYVPATNLISHNINSELYVS